MFTQPAPAPTSPGLGTPVVSEGASSSSSATNPIARASRLRGLSYLRNYTQTHLLSREHSNGHHHHHHNHNNNHHGQNNHGAATSTSSNPAVSCTTGVPALLSSTSHTQPSSPALESPNPLARAATHPNIAAAASTTEGQTSTLPPIRPNRFSLVPGLPNPLASLNIPLPSSLRSQDPTTTASSIVFGRRSTEAAAIPTVVTTAAASGTIENTAPGSALSEDNNTMTRARSATTGDAMANPSIDVLPSIRFSTFYDPRATQPSLTFAPVSRTLPTGNEIIRVGRYSERESQPNVPHNVPSAAPVGFKSKVVSRRHCEFWYKDGKWYIKDVKSSSGTFLNHIRLSPAGAESKPFPVNDGDIVQLGIDFKGGEEMIFRCVKMRLELNRGWQNKLNTFNMNTHQKLREMTANSGNASSYSQDCSICLNRIAPCQCLFVAPCSHTWHYKCIRSLLSAPSYPIFICPNCRAAADLEADVEEPEEEWEQLDSDEGIAVKQEGASLLKVEGGSGFNNGADNNSLPPPRKSRESVRSARQALLAASQQAAAENGDVTMNLDPPLPVVKQESMSPIGSQQSRPSMSHSTSNPMPIPIANGGAPVNQRAVSVGAVNHTAGGARTPSPTSGIPTINGHEGPITPRNDAGPWVFDGSSVIRHEAGGGGSGPSSSGAGRINSLEAAVNGGMKQEESSDEN
ncbi:hypothetical protein QBC37DRAFT_437674 [Rhypophila decipiens]|uniref:RING-type E3 ubiquitin transferase n=1 Tax=Rhypophila decipiens TaxID=261697 RepID=A0AAN6YKH7_9PEZI|nr:hypothetical protein QBC37DRAFT_437674 [Rhypophila decipiens]